LRAGDVIVRFDRRDVQSTADLHRSLDHETIDRRLDVEVLRAGALERLAVSPREMSITR
jgi:S1-C subfamily serine protease